MKSEKAEQILQASSFMNECGYHYVHYDNVCKAIEIAEQEAEKDLVRYCQDLEESKKREELARKVIADQRKEIEKLKALAVEALKDYMTQKHGGYLSSDLDDFLQKII